MSGIFSCDKDMDDFERATWQEEVDPIERDRQPLPKFIKRKVYTPNIRL